MPHILVFNRSYPPDLGATGQLLAELCEDLAASHALTVTVVAGRPTVTLEAEPAAKGGHVVSRESRAGVTVLRVAGTRLGKARFAGRLANYLSYCAVAPIAPAWARRPDVVLSLTDPPLVGLIALAWARRWRVPFVFLCQDVFPEVAAVLEDFQSARVNRALDGLNRLLLRRAAAVVAIGETMAAHLVRKGADPTRVTVIHNWADRGRIRPREKSNAFAVAHGLADRFVVLHSGNLGLSQGLETLVQAAGLLQDLPDLTLVFQGDGVKRQALAAEVERLRLRNVRFLPYAPKDRLAEAFAAADVQVVSLRRGLAGFIVPSKLYGILASARPYVAAVEQASEVALLTERYGSGLVVPPGEPDALAKAIRRLYEDRPLRDELGARGLEAAARHDRAAAALAYARLVGALIGRPAVATDLSPLRDPVFKRAFDALLAGAGLVASLPLWGAIALAIKLDDGGAVFFRDERVGRGGRRFQVLKFRSMHARAEGEGEPRQARQHDPRVTRVGRLLRPTAMDELPQLWNIFKGDMSFVGPRALRPVEAHIRGDGTPVRLDSIPGYAERHRIRPGLTGLAQVYADRDVPPRQKFRYDRLYLRRRNLRLDLRLIALSFWISLRGRWEHRARGHSG